MTLEEIIRDSDKGDVRNAWLNLTDSIKKAEQDKLDKFKDVLFSIIESQKELKTAIDEMKEVMQKVADRPDPKFPEFPPFPEQKEFPKFPEPLPYPEQKDLSPLLEELIERIGNEHSATRGVLTDLLNKEPEYREEEKKEGKFPLNIGSIRRHSRWQIATYPNIAGTAAITSAGDGVTYYLPAAAIKNSETVRLNGGLPLSQGIDYTLTGNKIVYGVDQTNSQQEVRYQN